MTTFLLATLVCICGALVILGFVERSGIFELPFLVGASVAGYVLPQAVGLVLHPGMVPQVGLDKALLMFGLCLISIIAGWYHKVPREWLRLSRHSYLARSFYSVGLLCFAGGVIGYIQLTSLSGGIVSFYSSNQNFSWSGLAVMYFFLYQYSWLALPLLTLSALALRRKILLVPCLVLMLPELAAIVFLGRRTTLINVFILVGCPLYFGRGIVLPRIWILTCLPVAALAMFLAPEYRSHSQIGADGERFGDLDADSTLKAVFSGVEAELWGASYLIEITDDEHLYGLGSGLYNSLILLFVPKVIVGESGKENLLIGGDKPEHCPNRYGWEMPFGLALTGPATIYREFAYFGAAYFYLLARMMRYFWCRATAGRDLVFQVLYTVCTTAMILTVTNDANSIMSPIAMFCLPLILISKTAWLRKKHSPQRRQTTLDHVPLVLGRQ